MSNTIEDLLQDFTINTAIDTYCPLPNEVETLTAGEKAEINQLINLKPIKSI